MGISARSQESNHIATLMKSLWLGEEKAVGPHACPGSPAEC